MKIYTRTGDKGYTSLYNGKRVLKSDNLISLVGFLDELNSFTGFTVSILKKNINTKLKSNDDVTYRKLLSQIDILEEVQSKLFEIGSEVAYPEKHGKISMMNSVSVLEKQIDLMETDLDKLKNFILPGGSVKASQIHITRSVCRRVEREFITSKKYKNESVNIFLNRLSDYFFVLARLTNKVGKIEDKLWLKKGKA